jgi:CubicO group peptidase (beta-lactamase class C family)
MMTDIPTRRLASMAIPAIQTQFLCLFWLGLSLIGQPSSAAESDRPDDDIKAFLRENIDPGKQRIGVVVGLVDEQGSRIIGYGNPDNGPDREVSGDTVFEIGSITKTFTALLLQDMVERREMAPEDPASKWLPTSVTVPTRGGREIRLIDLATHTSGLPAQPHNVKQSGDASANPFVDYTVEKFYAFLSDCRLTRAPGERYEYSNGGMALLGHAMALRAGTDYEALVVERICRPLRMDSTRIILTPEMQARLATGQEDCKVLISVPR